MAIVKLTAQDAGRCQEVAETVGWITDPSRWAWMITLGQAYGALDPQSGALLGTIIDFPFGERFSMVAMMMVRPSHQQRGLGARLLRHLLDLLPTENVTALYASEVGEKLYRPFGFLDAGGSVRWDGWPQGLVRPTSRLREIQPRDAEAIVQLDAEAQGGPRAELLSSLLADSDRGFLVEDARGRVVAFGLAVTEQVTYLSADSPPRRLTHVYRRLGPIVAFEDADALSLANRLAEGAEHVRLDLEPGEAALRGWAARVGLVEGETSPRLVLGGAMPGQRRAVRALAGRPFG